MTLGLSSAPDLNNLKNLNMNLNFGANAGLLASLAANNSNNAFGRKLDGNSFDLESMQGVLDRHTEMSPFQSSVGGASNNNLSVVNGEMSELHKAVESKDLEKVKKLLEDEDGSGVDVNEKFMGFTPLMLACVCGCGMEIVRILLDKGASMDVKDNDNCSILHHAVSRCDVELVSGILEYTKENSEFALVHAFLLNSTDKQNNSVLHYVSCKNRAGEEESKNALMIVKILKEHGCLMDKRNMAGETALHWAVHNRNEDVAEELISSGSNPYLQDNNSVTPDQAKKNPESFNWQPAGVKQFFQRDQLAHQSAEVSSNAQAEQLLLEMQRQQQQQQQQQLPWQQKPSQPLNSLQQLLQQQQPQQLQQSLSMLSSGNNAMQILSQLQMGNNGLAPVQNLSLPPDFRLDSARSMLDNNAQPKEESGFSGIEQILREQNRQLEQQILELHAENLVLRDRMLQMESQLKEYRAFAEQQLKIILRGYGVETDQASSLFS
eukprot:TRINITY_DN6680_c1_g2_i3.p1 TRINITY_DN6680_c1_g2~~TRINITY_DN6680_c1_g2_i3.p1  ORF type:complete len:520 (+),score=105.13 TRINITY_DN6680_c1_g2_i3:87-1562(+)